jgi:hypothetical protein
MGGKQKRIRRVVRTARFPFTGTFELKSFGEFLDPEPGRDGEDGRRCGACDQRGRLWWRNDRWKLTEIGRTINPVGLFLETIEHVDIEHFDDDLAAEFGVITRHLDAAIMSVASVGRTHVHRWGDGSAHFHVWFQGRPRGHVELHGWGNVIWSQLLPPLPQATIDANHQTVIMELVERVGGECVDQPSRGRSLRWRGPRPSSIRP